MERIRAGIVGGAHLLPQLHAHPFNFDVPIHFLDHEHNNYQSLSKRFYVGDPQSYDDVLDFAKHLQVLTIASENTNVQALTNLQSSGIRIYPQPRLIELVQNVWLQKQFFKSINLPAVPALKTTARTLANTNDDNDEANDEPSLLELLVNVKRELSLVISRDESGNIEAYDPILMRYDHRRLHIDLHGSRKSLKKETAFDLCEMAITIADELQLCGAIGVEALLTNDNKLYVNRLFLPLAKRSRGAASTPTSHEAHIITSLEKRGCDEAWLTLLGLNNEYIDIRGLKNTLRQLSPLRGSSKEIDDQLIFKSRAIRQIIQL